jgi:amidase
VLRAGRPETLSGPPHRHGAIGALPSEDRAPGHAEPDGPRYRHLLPRRGRVLSKSQATRDRTLAHPECVEAVAAAAKLCEELGHRVECAPCPFDEGFHEDFFLYWAALAFSITRFGTQIVHPEFDRTQVEEFTEGLASYFRENASKGPGALVRLRRFAHRHARVFEQYDVLMNPTLATPPPELGFIGPEVPFETALERLKWFIPFTPVQNVSGTPAISLPLTRSQGGLPIGIQLGSAMGAERTLLELAIELEEASPWPTLAG